MKSSVGLTFSQNVLQDFSSLNKMDWLAFGETSNNFHFGQTVNFQ